MGDSAPGGVGKRRAIVDILVDEGIVTDEQLGYATRVHAKLADRRPLLQILQELGYVEAEAIRGALTRNRVDVRLGELLIELGLIREEDLQHALDIQSEQTDRKLRLGEVLVEHHFIEERKLTEALAYQLGYPFVEPQFAEIEPGILSRAPRRWLIEHEFVPIRSEDGHVVVAFSNPLDEQLVRAAETVYGDGKVIPAIAPPSAIREALGRMGGDETPAELEQVVEQQTVDLVNDLFDAAIERNASDIHIEPMKDRIRVRFREDGVLIPFRELPKDVAAPVCSRIKVLCGADIAERRRHQDGRLFYEAGSHQLDMRVSFYATIHGEKIVLRLLNRQQTLLSLAEVGMAPRMLERFIDGALERPSGVVIVTGPTGSGKTTTLYSAIQHINSPETSIITAEDPVEYVIDGVAQCSINPGIGLGFEETLRHIVRQDPDVIVIGEIRDPFSAETAIQAALTGHKVITTFHTEDTIGGLLRLLNMDIEAFMVSSTVVSVVAQRLLRRVCPDCTRPYKPTASDLRRLGYSDDAFGGHEMAVGRGCGTCRYTGYHGRVAIFELLVLEEEVRDAILNRRTSHEIRRVSREASGLVSLLEEGIVKAARGLTTVDEIVRMLPRLDRPRPLRELRRLVGE
ncbi:MAG: GspE/PulE family protein [Proteobacteria bacterium]|nr:GspE/PulE family protein [Pseudomonadota bacterium]